MRNSKCILMFYILCVLLLFSCGSKVQEKKFFDIPGYFKGEIELIKSTNYTISKTFSYNGNGGKQEMKASEVNWDKEFAIFLESDVNKPVYYANMNELPYPSHAFEGSKSKITYGTTSKKLNVQFVEIVMERGNAISVLIKISKSNLISNTTIDAYYAKGIRYSIIGTQTIKQLGDKNEFWVEGKFYN